MKHDQGRGRGGHVLEAGCRDRHGGHVLMKTFVGIPGSINLGLILQIRSLPEAQSDHAAICRAALIKITDKVLNRSK